MGMRLYFLCFVTVLLFCASSFGQDTAPKPKPTPPDEDVVRISTSLIQVDVSVVDSKGKVITDLKANEIEIYENGQKQKITNFSFVSTVRTSPETEKKVVVDKAAVPVPSAVLRAEKIKRTFALAVDDLSLSFESAYQTRRALRKFVDEQMQDGDLVAIIRTGAGIGALQQFTSDKRMLYAAIERVKWNPLGSGGISAFAPIEPPLPGASPTPDENGDTPAPVDAARSLDDFRSSVFATGTLGALKYIVTGMSDLPGRKTVVLFSDGFKLFETDENGFMETGRVMDFLRELIDTANRSSVVFYTLDARGLQYTGMTAADAITDTSPDAINKISSDRRDQLLDTQEGLDFLAAETGGFSVKNSNDLADGVRKVLDDQSYYLIAYEPDSDTFDAAKRKFNKLEVKVLRKGLTARYRSGFFNVASEAVAKAPVDLTPTQQIQSAMTSPFAVSGINLRLNALFGNDATTGSFVRSLLHIDARDLTFVDEKGGSKKATFDVMAASFGDNGALVDQIGKTYTFNVSAAGYKIILEQGFVYRFAFPIKKPGAFQFRVAVRDVNSGKLGSASEFIEVPDLKKNRLTLSSIVFENLTENDWQKLSDPNGGAVRTNPLGDTALRRIKAGTILHYGFEIYDARLDPSKKPDLQVSIRVFHDGQVILNGRPAPVDMTRQTDPERIKYAGAFSLGSKMAAGDYILQTVVTDRLAKSKQQIATQFVQFEVVE